MANHRARNTRAKIAEKLTESRAYTMSPEEGHDYLMRLASSLKLDLRKANIEETRRILSKGTPLSYMVREMRGR